MSKSRMEIYAFMSKLENLPQVELKNFIFFSILTNTYYIVVSKCKKSKSIR